MNTFAVLKNAGKPGAEAVAEQIAGYLDAHGRHCSICADGKEIPQSAECILVLGGDGTLLRAAKSALKLGIPLLGINLGTLGYLAEVDVASVESALDALMAGAYIIENRMMLTGTVLHAGRTAAEDLALNDTIIQREKPMRTFMFRNYVNGIFLNEYRADGVIVSTPTGSTGYSLSVGGPIVSPSASLLVLSPIAAHTINTRSIVFSGSDRITVEIGGEEKIEGVASVAFDGEEKIVLDVGDKVHIVRAREYTKIIKISNVSFLEVLRRKMAL